ncbi:hypothetical protein FRB90_012276 [Tulasnella sp. 427]|nr:hypothetical protein FRB90_012276 [Tulasnella sp. 427]
MQAPFPTVPPTLAESFKSLPEIANITTQRRTPVTMKDVAEAEVYSLLGTYKTAKARFPDQLQEDTRQLIRETIQESMRETQRETQDYRRETQRETQEWRRQNTITLNRIEERLESLGRFFTGWVVPQARAYNANCGEGTGFQLVPFPDGKWPNDEGFPELRSFNDIRRLPHPQLQAYVRRYRGGGGQFQSTLNLQKELYQHLGLRRIADRMGLCSAEGGAGEAVEDEGGAEA